MSATVEISVEEMADNLQSYLDLVETNLLCYHSINSAPLFVSAGAGLPRFRITDRG